MSYPGRGRDNGPATNLAELRGVVAARARECDARKEKEMKELIKWGRQPDHDDPQFRAVFWLREGT